MDGKSQRIRIMTRYLYDRMPGAERVPEDANGVRMWGEVEHGDHYAFCNAIATSINLVDVRTHVEPD